MEYMQFFGTGMGLGYGTSFLWAPLVGLLILWSLVWKGMALWRAAHRSEKVWFIVFLVVNTLGILEIIYLYFIAKDKPSTNTTQLS